MGKNTVINVPTGRLTFTGHKPGVGLAYLAAASQAATQEERDEIRAVEEKLVGLNDRDLYLVAHDDQPVAKRIGGSNLRHYTLKLLAKFDLGERKRNRTDRKWLIGIIAGWIMA